jgi:TRAP-type mannitol/chloroaromatic compound transport system permease small subunit
MSVFLGIEKGIVSFNNFMGKVAFILVGVEAAFIVLSVFLRYALNFPFKASTEIQMVIMVLVAFLGAAYVLNTKGHVYVEVFLDRFKPKARNFITGISYLLLGVPYCGILFYLVFLFVRSSYMINEHTQGAFILLWPIKAVFLLGFCMLGLQFLVTGIRSIYNSVVAGNLSSERSLHHD